MKRILLLTIFLAACGAPYQYKVYDRDGKLYQAPELCKAVTDCLSSGKSCFYLATEYYECKEQK